jgi:competence protein ComEC
MGLLRGAPLALFAASFGAGLAAADLGLFPLPLGLALLGLSGAGLALALRRGAEPAFWGAAALLVLSLGSLRHSALVPPGSPSLPPGKAVFAGTVESVPVLDDEAKTTSFLLPVAAPPGARRGPVLRVTLHWRDTSLEYGDLVRVRGRAIPPRPATNPGQSDLASSFSRRGIDGTLAAWNPADFSVSGHGGGSRVRRALLAVRAAAERRLDALVGRPESDLLASVVFGFRAGFPPETIDAFQTTGLMHILVASGLNVGLLAWLCLKLLALLRVPPARASLATLPVLGVYLVLCGGETPLLRSTLMFAILVGARAAGRAPAAVNALGLTALLILGFDPSSLHDRSFQLSFTATLGVLVLVPWLKARMPFLPGIIAEAAACTLSAQLFLFPLLAGMFMSVPLLGVLANLLVTPAMGVMLAGGLALLAFGWVPLAGAALGAAMRAALAAALKVVTAFSLLPLASVVVPPLSPLATAAWLAWGIGSLLWMADAARRGPAEEDAEDEPWDSADVPPGTPPPRAWPRAAALSGAAALAALAWEAALKPAPGDLSATFLDAGQGLAVAVRLPSGRTVLYDAGGAFAGGAIVVPFLRSSGTGRLPAFLLSHAHSDHSGGAAAVVRRLKVDMAVAPPGLGSSPGGEEGGEEAVRLFLAAAGRRGVPVARAVRGDRLEGERGVRIEFLGPPRGKPVPAAKADAADENGLAVLVEYGSTSLLLPGDIRARGEAGLQCPAGSDLLLQVPHHGSAKGSSRGLLTRLAPRLAVVSCGRSNSFGHPHPATLIRYREQGAEVIRTDLMGAVTAVSDGKCWRVTARGSRRGP